MGNCLDVCVAQRKKSEKSLDICSASQLETSSPGKCLPEDCFSSLPDDVLVHMLSFLTFKEKEKMSLVSHRWLNLWVHTPVLDFHPPVSDVELINDQERQGFVNWVNRVLQRYKGQFLKEFKIVCDLDKYNRKDIDNWLVFAFTRKVQSLELNLLVSGWSPSNLRDNYVFPDRFLNFSSRKADSDGGGSELLQFDLKCLKSLSLKSVEVSGEAINFFLSNCPFIERLEVVGTCKLANLVISGPNLSLKYLQIKYCNKLEVLSVSNFNLVSLDIPTVRDLTLADLPMLAELSISKSPFSLSRSLSQASSCHSQLEFLMLQGYKLEDITQLSNFDQLTKLKRLVINVGAFGDESLTMLVPIINSCPHLEEFVLMLVWFDPERNSTRTIYEAERRGCSLKSQSLKVFEFNGYYGRASDVELVLHLVENAVCLEKIIIDPRDVLRFNDTEESEDSRGQEARSIALQQYKALKESNSIPPNVHLLIR